MKLARRLGGRGFFYDPVSGFFPLGVTERTTIYICAHLGCQKCSKSRQIIFKHPVAAMGGFCKYRDHPRRGRVCCPYGCTNDVTVCHKWAKHECRYNSYPYCRFGVHSEPAQSGQSEDQQEPTPKRQKPSPQSEHDQVVELIAKMIQNDPLLSSPQSTYENQINYLKRMLRTLHPDKAKETSLEPVFTDITKIILDLKASITKKEGVHA